jgi:hypothetical protein
VRFLQQSRDIARGIQGKILGKGKRHTIRQANGILRAAVKLSRAVLYMSDPVGNILFANWPEAECIVHDPAIDLTVPV